jgi:hypothetical protein
LILVALALWPVLAIVLDDATICLGRAMVSGGAGARRFYTWRLA